MSITNLLDEKKIKLELCIFLRNSNIFSITDRGVTTETDSGMFSSDSTHTLAVTPTLIKNVRSVVIGGISLDFGTDYLVEYNTGVISFVTSQTGIYSIIYDVGNTDKIFTDIPQVNLTINSYPRIGLGVTSTIIGENDVSGTSNITELLLSFYVYGVGTDNTDDYITTIRSLLLLNKSFFYYLRFITPSSISPMINEPARGDKIFTRVLDALASLNVEVIN